MIWPPRWQLSWTDRCMLQSVRRIQQVSCDLTCTGYFSRLSYHCNTLPTKNANEPRISVSKHQSNSTSSKLTPERCERRLILSPMRRRVSKTRTQEETNTSDCIPEADPPSDDVEGRFLPMLLRFDREHQAGYDEADSSNGLRGPVEYGDFRVRHVVEDSRQGGNSRNIEDCC